MHSETIGKLRVHDIMMEAIVCCNSMWKHHEPHVNAAMMVIK